MSDNSDTTLKINMAMTLDGRVMLPDGRWHGLTSASDRLRMDLYRMEAQAVIVGRNSVEQDDPVVVPRISEGDRRPLPVPVMICRSALPSPDRKMFNNPDGPDPILFIAEELKDELGRLADSCAIESLPRESVTPINVLKRLAELDRTNVLLEGGPRLNHAFLSDDLVDVIYMTIVPFIVGRKELPGIAEGDVPIPDFEKRGWQLKAAENIQDELFLRYERDRPHRFAEYLD